MSVALMLALIALTGAESTSVLIKGGTVVNHDHQLMADVLVEDGLITAIGPNLHCPSGCQVVDATGSLVMPGGIDPHTHMDMPFMGKTSCDDFFSGQAAALAGGTTMHIDFALPVEHDLMAGWETWQVKAEKSCMDYSFHMAVTFWNKKTHADMATLTALGINSFKFFMAYKGALMVNDEQLLEGLARCKELGVLPMVHAENGEAVAYGQKHTMEVVKERGPYGHALSRPAMLEGEATGRAIRLAAFIGVPLYVVHVMSEDAMSEIAAARKKGQLVIGEAVASGITLEESVMKHKDFSLAAQFVMSPPIRAEHHRLAVRQALSGDVLQVLATDHCSFNTTQKAAGRQDFRLIPNGVHGVEERMHVAWEELVNSGLMNPQDYVRVTSTAAAQLFNMYPRKGRLAVGSDADIIVLDPSKDHVISAATHHHNNDLNIYEGKLIRGKVEVTISRGRIVWQHGKLSVTPGTGRFLPLDAFGPVFGRTKTTRVHTGLHKFPQTDAAVEAHAEL